MHITTILAALALDRHGAVPLFRQLYGALKDAILSGTISPGMQLPPTRQFCQLLSVSRQTVLNAYDQLIAEGYLSGSVGKGTYVSAQLPLTTRPPARDDTAAALRPLTERGELIARAMGSTRHHTGALCAFRPSMPGIDLFPFALWSRLEARRWRERDAPFGYGDPAGDRRLRELLCVYLKASRGVRCTPEQIVITSGSQQALFLLSMLLLGPGDTAWVESPGYLGACAPLIASGAAVCTVPVDAQGLDLAWAIANCPPAQLVFATPSHQLPLGVTMSLQRRLALLDWAAANRAWIVEDDYDSEYRYTGPPLASMQGLDRVNGVIYVGTLSKVLFPGLRLGYLVAPPAIVEPITRARALVDRHSAIAPQRVLADFIEGGHFARHIKRTREAYAERRATMLAALKQHVGHQLMCGPSDAGLDVCVHFRGAHNEQAVVQAGAARGIDLRALSYYTIPNAVAQCAVRPGLLLGFAAVTPPRIEAGVRVLAEAMNACK